MKKLLVVCGPTATGKTRLAIRLAKKLMASGPRASGPGGEIISADSRQVYKDFNIGTGKDIPEGSKFTFVGDEVGGYYTIDGVRVWGYDLVPPRGEFSVADFVKFAQAVTGDIHKRGKLPIVEGGTGFYISALVDGIDTTNIPRNRKLRKVLEKKPTEELVEILRVDDPVRLASMNMSDRKNPRRLIRAIEIARAGKHSVSMKRFTETLFVGARAGLGVLDERVERRVSRRMRQGFVEEVERLLRNGSKWCDQAMQSLGYRQAIGFINGTETKDEFARKWVSAEKKYTKRQLTWFRRDNRINWFDISEQGFQEKVEELVNKWYKKA